MPIISDITLKHDLPRTTTKAEYKEISRWLRDCRRITNKRIDKEWQSMLLGIM